MLEFLLIGTIYIELLAAGFCLMFKVLFSLFIVVPTLEIFILLQLSGVIGGWSTILVVILTAYLGAKMVKQQGLQTIAKIQQKSASGQIPGEELFSGVCILISGVLLLTPGILTDVLGFLLLTPIVRKQMADVLKQKIHLFGAAGGQAGQPFTFTSSSFTSHEYPPANELPSIDEHPGPTANDEPNSVIDGEFKRKD
jgi:UPF0716 protein FxsA